MSLEREVNRYSIVVRDFEDAIRFAEEAAKFGLADTAYEALVFAAIVCYVRPFSDNEIRDKSPFAVSRLFLDDILSGPLTPPVSETERRLHESCVFLRNKALAHSEYGQNPTWVSNRGVFVGRRFSILSLPAGYDPSDSDDDHFFDLAMFCELARNMVERCHARRAEYRRTAE